MLFRRSRKEETPDIESVFAKLKDLLCPIFDRAYTAFVEDLDARGLLDSTLVVAVGEFGRTPSINPVDGRDHVALVDGGPLPARSGDSLREDLGPRRLEVHVAEARVPVQPLEGVLETPVVGEALGDGRSRGTRSNNQNICLLFSHTV